MKIPPGLRLIAGFKLAQGLVLVLVGAGLSFLITRDPDAQVAHWLAALQIDTDNTFMHSLLSKLDAISPLKFQRLSIGAFFYAGLLMTEGTGLLLQKRWAEFLTVFVTGSFLPWESFEVARHFNLAALAILTVNAAIVWYLVNALVDKRRKRHLSGEV